MNTILEQSFSVSFRYPVAFTENLFDPQNQILADVLRGYVETAETTEPWMEAAALDRLMRIYGAYHGLAGLAWCHDRDDANGEFAAVNRGLIRDAAGLIRVRPGAAE
jgi:hypothetical protein